MKKGEGVKKYQSCDVIHGKKMTSVKLWRDWRSSNSNFLEQTIWSFHEYGKVINWIHSKTSSKPIFIYFSNIYYKYKPKICDISKLLRFYKSWTDERHLLMNCFFLSFDHHKDSTSFRLRLTGDPISQTNCVCVCVRERERREEERGRE